MVYSSPTWKRHKSIFSLMDSESAKATLAAAKEKYGRELRVFETSLASAAPPSVSDTEVGDEYYDFTPEDYYRLLGTKKEDKFLKTKKIRDREEVARRAKMTKITKAVIRVRFPDNYTLEVPFHPSETIHSLFDLLKKVLANPEQLFYLFTTPPKKQIKEMSQDFYDAGFVPGAIVYFAAEGDALLSSSGHFLQDEVMSLQGLEAMVQQAEPAPEPAQGPVETSQVIVPERKSSDKKNIKPKWLKM